MIVQSGSQITNNKCASVPWKLLSQDIKHQYIDAAALLSDVFLLDLSKLCIGVINEIWNH